MHTYNHIGKIKIEQWSKNPKHASSSRNYTREKNTYNKKPHGDRLYIRTPPLLKICVVHNL